MLSGLLSVFLSLLCTDSMATVVMELHPLFPDVAMILLHLLSVRVQVLPQKD